MGSKRTLYGSNPNHCGGQGEKGNPLTTIEVMSCTETHVWSTAVDLPQPTAYGSLKHIGDDRICMIGGLSLDKSFVPIKPGYMCPLSALLQSCSSKVLWEPTWLEPCRYLVEPAYGTKVADIPAISSTYVLTFHGL